MQRVILAADHAGFYLKEKLKALMAEKYEIIDVSPKLVEGDDYPDIAFRAGKMVAKTHIPGIFICGSGEGMCIASNKVKGIRAGIGYDVASAIMSKNDDDTNVLCLAGMAIKEKDAFKVVKAWLSQSFEGGRHARRVGKIKKYEMFRF